MLKDTSGFETKGHFVWLKVSFSRDCLQTTVDVGICLLQVLFWFHSYWFLVVFTITAFQILLRISIFSSLYFSFNSGFSDCVSNSKCLSGTQMCLWMKKIVNVCYWLLAIMQHCGHGTYNLWYSEKLKIFYLQLCSNLKVSTIKHCLGFHPPWQFPAADLCRAVNVCERHFQQHLCC